MDNKEPLIAVVLVYPGTDNQQVAIPLNLEGWENALEMAVDKVKLAAYRLLLNSARKQAAE